MNDKLLRAFIEASGFDIKEQFRVYVSGVYIRTQDHKEEGQSDNQFSVRNEIDYKVTKRPVKDDGLITCNGCDGSGIWIAAKTVSDCNKCDGTGKIKNENT